MCYCAWQVWCKFWSKFVFTWNTNFLRRFYFRILIIPFMNFNACSQFSSKNLNQCMKVTVSNRSYHLIVGKKMAMDTTAILQFLNKVYFMDLLFRNSDYYTKMWKFLPAKYFSRKIMTRHYLKTSNRLFVT